MKNRGIRQYRFDSNPLERRFAEAWEELNNTYNHKGILNYLLTEDSNNPNFEITDREREVAATVIQWLGSPVGQKFIDSIMGTENLVRAISALERIRPIPERILRKLPVRNLDEILVECDSVLNAVMKEDE